MKKRTKKLLSMVMAISMAASAFSAFVFSASAAYSVDEVLYGVDAEGVITPQTDFTGDASEATDISYAVADTTFLEGSALSGNVADITKSFTTPVTSGKVRFAMSYTAYQGKTSRIKLVDSDGDTVLALYPEDGRTTGEISNLLVDGAETAKATVFLPRKAAYMIDVTLDLDTNTYQYSLTYYSAGTGTTPTEVNTVTGEGNLTNVTDIAGLSVLKTNIYMDNIMLYAESDPDFVPVPTPEPTPTPDPTPDPTPTPIPEPTPQAGTDEQVLIDEDFSTVTDTWGFEGGGGQAMDTANGYLQLTTNNAAGKESVKTLDEAVSQAEFLNIKFDWASNVENNKDRSSYFVLRDSDDKVFFGMFGIGNRKANGIKYTTSGDPDWTEIETQTPGKFYTIDINVDFVGGTLSGTISNTSTGTVLVTIPATKIDAKNFANMRGYDYYSLAPQLLDNVKVSVPQTYKTTFKVTSDEDNSPLSGAEIVVGTKTLTTGDDGTAEIMLASGEYSYTVTAEGHQILDTTVTVSGAAEVPVVMEYAGASVVTKVEISGGDAGIYKPKSGSNSTVNKYTAVVYDQTEQPMDTEEVTWSIVAAAEGASISDDGIVTVTDAFPVADINGETIVVKAASKTNPEISATVNLHVYDVARATTFDIVGPSAVKDGVTVTYTIGNIKDQYGVDYTGNATFTLSTDATDVTIDGMNVTPNTGTVQTKDFTLTATSSDTDYQGNNVTATKNVTAYAFDFYESQVNGSAYGDVRTAEVAGATYTVWPASGSGAKTQTITLPVPVEMTPGSAKLITYSTAWTNKTVTAQERYMTLDFSGEEAKDLRIGYQGGVYIDPAKNSDRNFTSDISLGNQGSASTFEETLILVKTDINGNSTATISYAGGTPVVVELGSNIGSLTSFAMLGGKGAPDDRLLAIKDIKISDSDIAEVEITGSDKMAKISGAVATKTYEASVFALADGETFTWSVDWNGTGGGTSKRVFELTKPATSAIIVKVVYNEDETLKSITTTPVTIEEGAQYVDAPEAEANTEFMLWDSLDNMTPLAAGIAKVPTGIEPSGVTIDQNGVLSVADTVAADTVVTITYTSDLNADKTASKEVTIKDFANIESFTVNGPATVNAGDKATYSVSDIVDEYGDAVNMIPAYAITVGSDIASIDAQAGILTTSADKAGNVTISATLGNPGKTKTVTKDIVIGKFSVSGESNEATVTVNVSELANYTANTKYLITTATADSVIVTQAEVAHTDGKVVVDMEGAKKYEVSPIYEYTSVGDVKNGKEIPVCDGLYDFTFVKSGGSRGDIYVNDCIVGNNVDQSGKQRTTGGTVYTVKDVKVEGGSAVVRMTDDSNLSSITVKKAPSILERKTHVYIAGDSTAASYNGKFGSDVEIIGGLPRAGQAQTGWGQVFEQFVSYDVNVTNLAESGNYAEGWYNSYFKGGVINQAEAGDYFIVSFGINDRNYSNGDKMAAALTNMINECREIGVIPVLVSSQRWSGTYGDGAAAGWEGYFDKVISVAEENGALNVNLTDLTYDYFETIGKEKVTQNYNVYYGGASQDGLHLSYFGAMKCAEIIAQSIADQQAEGVTTTSGESFEGLTINKNASYTFTLVDDTTETLKVD